MEKEKEEKNSSTMQMISKTIATSSSSTYFGSYPVLKKLWPWVMYLCPWSRNLVSWGLPEARWSIVHDNYSDCIVDDDINQRSSIIVGRVPTPYMVWHEFPARDIGLVISVVDPSLEMIVSPDIFKVSNIENVIIDTPDEMPPDPEKMIVALERALDVFLIQKKSVYIHCMFGRGRSVAMTALLLAALKIQNHPPFQNGEKNSFDNCSFDNSSFDNCSFDNCSFDNSSSRQQIEEAFQRIRAKRPFVSCSLNQLDSAAKALSLYLEFFSRDSFKEDNATLAVTATSSDDVDEI